MYLYIKSLAVVLGGFLALAGPSSAQVDQCLGGNQNRAARACRALQTAYPGQVYLAQNPTYAVEADAIWSLAAWKDPACVFSPRDAPTLAAGLKILVDGNVQFAVRSGGHMPVTGHASIGPGGVMIATTHFRDLQEVQLPNQLNVSHVRMGAAIRWQEVYEYLDVRGLISAGGRVSSVGSSLLLGGGLSYFSGYRGWAANNIANYEVVLANSSIIQVNAKSHPDLFWALKGGTNNFGIVTRYDLITYGSHLMYGGTVVWPSNATQQYLDAQTKFILPGGGSDDVKAAIMPNFGYDPITKLNNSGTVILYDAPVDKPAALKDFADIPTISGSASVTNFSKITNTTAGYSPRDRRWSFYNIAISSSKDTMNLIYAQVKENADRILPGVNCSVGAAVQPVTRTHLQSARDLGGDAMDLDPARGNFVIALIYGYWFNAEDDAKIKEWTDATLAGLKTESEKRGIYYPWLFLNDAGVTQDPIATYGYGKSLPKMRNIAKKYDPDRVFQRNVPGFKLSGEKHSC